MLEVPAGSGCDYLGGGRLILPVEGRRVELTPVHPDGLHDELAREVAAFLDRRQDTLAMPERPRGPVVWLSLLPLAIPFLAVTFGKSTGGAVGFLVWGVFAALLGAVCLLLTTRRRWSAETRAWGAVLTSLVGYFALAVGLRIDHGDAPAPAPAGFGEWCALAPLDSGYRVEMPGRPARRASGFLLLPEPLAFEHCVEVPATSTVLLTAHGDRIVAGAGDPLQSTAKELAVRNGGQVVSEREFDLDGRKGREVLIDSATRGKILARVYLDRRRVFLTAFASRGLPTTREEAKRFLDSFAFDPSTGWPGR